MESHSVMFIQDLAIIMLLAGAITVVCRLLKQPIVLGYILAGIIIGPYTPPFSFIHDLEIIKTLAQVGVIFLMFNLGLEFDLQKLKKVGMVSFVAAFAEIILMLWIGYQLGLLFGWTTMDAIFLGAILSISSTTIIVKALEELGLKQDKFAQLIFGILIVEDIFAIAILAVLSGMAITGTFQVSQVLVTGTKLISFLVFSLVFGILLIPKFIGYIAKFQSKEMLLITVLALCFGFCLLVVKLDYSIALGAFIIGSIIAESKQLETIEQLMLPLRDMFSAIFFVSVGLLLDPKVVVQYALPILIITIVVVFGKVITCSLGVFFTGKSAKTSMRVGMGLAQIGEFSFIIASLGINLKVASSFLFPIAVAVSVITTFLTPYLIKYSDPILLSLSKVVPSSVAQGTRGYTLWIKRIKSARLHHDVKSYFYKSIWYVAVNLFFITGIFFASIFLAESYWGMILAHIIKQAILNTIIWACALLLCLPFLIAIYRRIKALTLLLLPLGDMRSLKPGLSSSVRIVVAEGVAIFFTIIILLLIIVMSGPILPPKLLLALVSVIIFFLVAFLYEWFAKLHTKFRTKVKKVMDDRDK